MEKELLNLRTDDLPLLYTLIRQLGVAKSINRYITVHGNWIGPLPGTLLELWLCYILSNCDHRLSKVEKWAEQRIDLLRSMSGLKELSSYDFSDDKLGLLLDYFSEDRKWGLAQTAINSSILEVYRIEELEDLSTFRLDAAPMQGYGQIEEEGLRQYGYHKHHADLPQFKIKLCTLDNQVNHFAYPVCHLTISGNVSDDELYIPIIKQSKEVLSGVSAYTTGNLYVGDSKFGSISNRCYVVSNKDYYLMPLSLVQLSKAEREKLIKASLVDNYEKVVKEKQGQNTLIVQGFEVVQTLNQSQGTQDYCWTERRVFVHSVSYAKSQTNAFEKRLNKASESIDDLSVRKQGKKVLVTKKEYTEAINNLLTINKVADFIAFQVKPIKTNKVIRAYGNRPERIEQQIHFEVNYWRKEEEIKDNKLLLGWQVYATNAPKKLLPFEKCVWKYRYQSNIESRFDDLRNKMAPLLPVFLQKDNRIIGLVNVLLLALKICAMMEYKIARALKDRNEQLRDVYEGNPKRGTTRPSAKRVFNAFDGISISLVFIGKKLEFALMTKLEPVQRRILELLGISPDIYTDLTAKIQMYFSSLQVTET